MEGVKSLLLLCTMNLLQHINLSTQTFVKKVELETTFDNNSNLDIIGILSICADKRNMTPFNHEAFGMHMGIIYGMFEQKFEDSFNYKSIDVCNDYNLLTNVLTTLILDKDYVEYNNITRNFESWIFCIFVFLPKDMVKISANLLLGTDLLLISLVDYDIFPDQTSSHPLYVSYQNITKRGPTYYAKLYEAYNFQYVTLVSLNKSQETYPLYKDLVNNLIESANTCFIAQLVETEEATQELLTKLEEDQILQVITLFGTEDDIYNFYSQLPKNNEEMNNRTYLHRMHMVGGDYHSSLALRLFNLTTKNLILESELTNKFLQYHPALKYGVYDNSYILFHLVELFIGLELSMASGEIDMLYPKPKAIARAIKSYLFTNRETFDQSRENRSRFTHAMKHPPITKCSNFTCGPGLYRIMQNDESSLWQNEYSFVCETCPENTIKTTTGMENCTNCTGKSISNKIRTLCFVPYILETFEAGNMGNIICMILNIIGILLSINVFVVFIKHRETPIVRASDTRITFLQLAALIAIFCLQPILLLSEVTVELCIIRPICFGQCFTLIVAITMAKAQKPLGAFRSRKRLSRKDIKVTAIQQYFIILLTLIVSALIAFVCFRQTPARVIVTYNEQTLIKSVMCNTDNHLHVQFLYLFILLVASLVQAFRSRKIPKNYSEAMNIVYSTFTCCVCLIVLPPIYYSQKEISNKLRVHWMIIVTINLVLLFALYGKKVYIMTFRPNCNTTGEFRRIALRNIRRDVDIRSIKRNSRLSVRRSTLNETRVSFLSDSERDV